MKKYFLLFACVLVSIVISGVAPAFAFELSADVITTGKGGQPHKSKQYFKGDKYRMEMQGQHQYTIFRQDKNVIWVVMPDAKSYMEMPYDSKMKPKVEGKFKGEINRTLIGPEVIDGHPTQKYEVTVKEGTKSERFYEWMATDINFSIKKSAIDGSWSEEYKNIQYSVPDTLFEVPADYQKFSISPIR
jgi:hypothetical protein